jgi:hypothetical protein
MKLYHLLFLVFLAGCDAVQEKSGIVLNSDTRQPLEGVAISKYEKADSTNNYTKRIYSDKNGQFEYRGIGGSNSFELYFIKEGFKIKKIENNDSDTILLEPIR